MKNFFKKLAFVLALAMIVTAIAPAGKASAASEPTLKQSAKVLYVGGDETGNIGDTYRFYFNNAWGYKATWKSSKTSVATVDATTGKIQAVAVGTTVITATLTNKAGNAVELDAKVYVKQNAEKIGFGSLAAVKEALAVGDTAKVNVYRQVGATKVWKQADKTLVTDVVKWTSSDSNVATVNKWGTITAVAAGKATITATATQSEGSVAVVSKSFPVEVAAGLTAVKQTSINTFDANFAGDLSAVATKDNVKVYSMVGSTKVNVLVKEVKFDKVDKTKAVVTTYTNLVKDTEYVVEYAETSATFKGADLSASAVAELKITPATVTKGKATNVVVKAYTAQGVEIPSANVDSRITISADTSAKFYLDTTNKQITFFNIGDTANVKATYHTYTYGTDFKEITIDASAVITSVDVVTTTVTGVDTFTVYTGTVDFDKASSTMSVSDTTGYKVAVKTKNSAGDEKLSTTDPLFTFESSDSTTLLINADNIYPVKAGGATVIVKYNGNPIGAYTVTIGAARAVSDVTASFNKLNLSASTTANDSVKLTVKIKDQYGVERTGDTVKVEYVTGPVNGNAANHALSGTANTEFVFNGSDYLVEGTYQYKVTVGNQVRYVYFTTKAPGTTVGYYQLSEAGKAVDTSLTVGSAKVTKAKEFTMDLAAYASSGYKMADITLYDKLADATTAANNATDKLAFYAEIATPSNYTGSFVTVSGGAVVVNPINVSDLTNITKMATGTYAVKVFKVDANGTTPVTTAVTVASFTVTDAQTGATVSVNKTASGKTTALEAIKDKDDVVTIKFGDKEYNANVVSVTTIGTGKTIAVTKAVVNVDVNYNGSVGTFVQEIAVNATITLQ